jgi:16S rRNA (uracil1498-N3)-methyltransferase
MCSLPKVTRAQARRKIKVHLLQGLPRGSKFDFVIEKAAELGVDSIQPFISDKNPIQSEAGPSKISRWERLAEAASKQCGRSTVPLIYPAVKLTDLSRHLKNCSLLLEVGEAVEPIHTVLVELKKDLPREIKVIVGPESGFSDQENEWLVNQGGLPVSLGKLTLRTETAGLVALSLVNYELGLL